MQPPTSQPATDTAGPEERRLPDGSLFVRGSCIELAQQWPDNSVDLIITDPPYGIDGDQLHQHYNRKEDFVVDGYVEVPAAEYGQFSREWIRQAARVLKPGGSLYVVSGYTHLYEVMDGLRQTELQELNHIVWKYNFGVHTRRKYVSSHYHILYYVKPGAPHTFNLECRVGIEERTQDGGSLNYRDREDVWIINREYKPGQQKNKNELPTELLAKMILYSSNPGDIVADFFLGGGSTARVAIGLGRKAFGIELAPATFAHATEKISQVVPGDLLAQIRLPLLADQGNRGKRWTIEDYEGLRIRFLELRRKGTTKGRAIEILGEELGRGRFSLLKAIDRIEDSNGRPDEAPLPQQRLLV